MEPLKSVIQRIDVQRQTEVADRLKRITEAGSTAGVLTNNELERLAKISRDCPKESLAQYSPQYLRRVNDRLAICDICRDGSRCQDHDDPGQKIVAGGW